MKVQEEGRSNDGQSIADKCFDWMCVDGGKCARGFKLVMDLVDRFVEERHVQQPVRPVKVCFDENNGYDGLPRHFSPRGQLVGHTDSHLPRQPLRPVEPHAEQL